MCCCGLENCWVDTARKFLSLNPRSNRKWTRTNVVGGAGRSRAADECSIEVPLLNYLSAAATSSQQQPAGAASSQQQLSAVSQHLLVLRSGSVVGGKHSILHTGCYTTHTLLVYLVYQYHSVLLAVLLITAVPVRTRSPSGCG